MEYREKLEKLSDERLELLLKSYQRTIKYLQEQYDQATLVAMLTVAEYSESELAKKKAEVAEIEQILEERRNGQKSQ